MADQTAIVAAFPEFSAVAAGTVTTFLGLAAETLDASVWGNTAIYNQGVAYLAMHMMARAGLSADEGTAGSGGGSVGGLSTERAGQWAQSYANPSTDTVSLDDADLMGTKFGRMYLRVRGLLPASAPMLVNPYVSGMAEAEDDS